ncbi:hypothetical protein FACS189415_0540 [Bacteroidia bacterium]|nr:hypothetical protein FACS189415_0540 [Bacteroidia bacterium]GHV70740.1 hypothetical protein FACS189420_3100 [Bacteroidia bacterium]
MCGVNPNQLSLFAYNLASEGQGTYCDNLLLNKYLPLIPKLKYVILCVNIHNLCFERSTEVEFFYSKFFDISFENKYYKESFLESFFVYNPQKTVSLIIENIKHENEKGIGEKGWRGQAISQYGDLLSEPKNKLKADTFNGELELGRYDNNALEYLESAIETLESNNITPILITCPIYYRMRRLLDERILNRVEETANYLKQKYNIIYFDFTDDERFEMEDYYDSDHLNTSGAEKLTKELDSVIEELEYLRKLGEE